MLKCFSFTKDRIRYAEERDTFCANNIKEFHKVIFHKQQSKKNLERLTGKTDRECQQKYEADSRHHPHSNDVQLYDEIIERLECNAKDWNITLSRVGDLQ